MSPSRRRGSRLIWTYCAGKMEVFRALVFVVYSLEMVIAQPPDFPLSTNEFSDDFLRSSFKPSPLLETYYEDQDPHVDDLDGSVSMQRSFLDLFMWDKPMPSTSIVNTFLENEDELPFLHEISDICPRKDFFYGMNPRHSNAVMMLKGVIMDQRSPGDCLKMAAGLRDRREVNPNAWLRAVIGATVHRRDLQGLRKPPIVEIMPSMFITNEVMEALEHQINAPPGSRHCVPINGEVGRDNGIENLLWYWREDVMLNAHHWYWHLSYPINGQRGTQDREGELFYFMHHNILSRYHVERLSVGLAPVQPFDVQPGARVPFGYNPHMHDGNSGNNWSARPPGLVVQDIMSDALPDAPYFISLRNRSIQLGRIFEGISMGALIDTYGNALYLDTDEGINFLGNTVEANADSINPEFYGFHGIHNNGHNIISLILDPRNLHGIPPGVMGEAATAMRDVMFYPYHEFVDNIFNRYKTTLPPYQPTQGDWPLLVHGVDIHSLKVQSKNLPANVLHTFWGSRKYDLSRGLDFNRSFVRGPLFACHQHLDHQDFDYELKVERKEHAHHAKTVTVRLFMGPRYDLKGRRYTLDEERHYMFILDTFTVPLKVGMNFIRRRSIETPLTIDFPQSIYELRQTNENTMPFCGCGWPHHLLLPKGTRDGLSLDLFAIITNSEEDAVAPDGHGDPQSCRPAYIFCGIMSEKYPDARPMGYPFDRRLYPSEKGPSFLENFVREIPNAALAHVKVIHYEGLSKDHGSAGFYEAGDFGHPETHQYLDEPRDIRTHLATPHHEVIQLDGPPNALSSPGPATHLISSPEVIESPEHIPGPPGPPPPPPRTILNLRLRPDITPESAPNFHSPSHNGLEDFGPTNHVDVHEDIRSAIDEVNPPPPPPPPGIGPVPHAHVGFSHGSLRPVKRPYRSAFKSSFRSLLKTFSPIGPVGGPPKSVIALLG